MTTRTERALPDGDRAGAHEREFGYTNVMQVPKLEKIVVNIGLGEAIQNAKALDAASTRHRDHHRPEAGDYARPRSRSPRSSSATGMPIGVMVTLRGERMYEFLDRLITSRCPRIRDFRGVSPSAFDGRGNYTLGLREQLVFPEIDYDKIDKLRGLEITHRDDGAHRRRGAAAAGAARHAVRAAYELDGVCAPLIRRPWSAPNAYEGEHEWPRNR